MQRSFNFPKHFKTSLSIISGMIGNHQTSLGPREQNLRIWSTSLRIGSSRNMHFEVSRCLGSLPAYTNIDPGHILELSGSASAFYNPFKWYNYLTKIVSIKIFRDSPWDQFGSQLHSESCQLSDVHTREMFCDFPRWWVENLPDHWATSSHISWL